MSLLLILGLVLLALVVLAAVVVIAARRAVSPKEPPASEYVESERMYW